MKTYKINGKEIFLLSGNSDYWRKKYGLEEIVETINSLIEALSDKEEVPSVTFSIPPGDKRMLTTDGGKTFVEYKPKQQECEHDYPYLGDNQDICTKCHEPRFKQSTSLKEEIWDNIDRGLQYYQYHTDDKNIPRTEYSKRLTEQTIKLIQSHLIKEVQYKPIGFECDEYNQGYNEGMRDIIKIINNLTK